MADGSPDYGIPLTASELWLSGKVIRYHASPTIKHQTTGEHAWGVAIMCKILFPEKFAQLVDYLLTHDAPELVLGDWPYPAKKLMNVYEREAECEAALMAPWQKPPGFMSEEDSIIFKVCDIVELLMQTAYEIGLGNNHVGYIHRNGERVLMSLLIQLEEKTNGVYRATAVHAKVKDVVSRIIKDQVERYLPSQPKMKVTEQES